MPKPIESNHEPHNTTLNSSSENENDVVENMANKVPQNIQELLDNIPPFLWDDVCVEPSNEDASDMQMAKFKILYKRHFTLVIEVIKELQGAEFRASMHALRYTLDRQSGIKERGIIPIANLNNENLQYIDLLSHNFIYAPDQYKRNKKHIEHNLSSLKGAQPFSYYAQRLIQMISGELQKLRKNYALCAAATHLLSEDRNTDYKEDYQTFLQSIFEQLSSLKRKFGLEITYDIVDEAWHLECKMHDKRDPKNFTEVMEDLNNIKSCSVLTLQDKHAWFQENIIPIKDRITYDVFTDDEFSTLRLKYLEVMERQIQYSKYDFKPKEYKQFPSFTDFFKAPSNYHYYKGELTWELKKIIRKQLDNADKIRRDKEKLEKHMKNLHKSHNICVKAIHDAKNNIDYEEDLRKFLVYTYFEVSDKLKYLKIDREQSMGKDGAKTLVFVAKSDDLDLNFEIHSQQAASDNNFSALMAKLENIESCVASDAEQSERWFNSNLLPIQEKIMKELFSYAEFNALKKKYMEVMWKYGLFDDKSEGHKLPTYADLLYAPPLYKERKKQILEQCETIKTEKQAESKTNLVEKINKNFKDLENLLCVCINATELDAEDTMDYREDYKKFCLQVEEEVLGNKSLVIDFDQSNAINDLKIMQFEMRKTLSYDSKQYYVFHKSNIQEILQRMAQIASPNNRKPQTIKQDAALSKVKFNKKAIISILNHEARTIKENYHANQLTQDRIPNNESKQKSSSYNDWDECMDRLKDDRFDNTNMTYAQNAVSMEDDTITYDEDYQNFMEEIFNYQRMLENLGIEIQEKTDDLDNVYLIFVMQEKTRQYDGQLPTVLSDIDNEPSASEDDEKLSVEESLTNLGIFRTCYLDDNEQEIYQYCINKEAIDPNVTLEASFSQNPIEMRDEPSPSY